MLNRFAGNRAFLTSYCGRIWYGRAEPLSPGFGEGVGPVKPEEEGGARGHGRSGAKGSGDEPEILEGLARDIVSRLATTLFGEGDLPAWERTASTTAAGPGPSPGGTAAAPAGDEMSGPPARSGRPPAGHLARSSVAHLPLQRAKPGGRERPAFLVRGTVRSGRQIRHNGDVVVLGDINPGGQVVAAGDVVVMGTLRGVVHAGATGDHSAVVAAFRLCPTQLRIASYVARPPEEPGGHPEYPEIALVRDGVVVVQPLVTGTPLRLGPDDAAPDPASGRRAF